MADLTKTERPSAWRRLPILAIVVVAVLGALTLRDQLSFQALAVHRDQLITFRDANYAATVAAFMAAYVAIVAFSLPGATVATLTGGFLFATFPGTAFNVLAATAGATLIFLAVRHGFGDRLAARMDAGAGRIRRMKRAIDANQWPALFLIRLLPVVPFFVANLLPAFVGVPTHRFVVTTFLGIIPGALVLTSVGAGLSEVFATGRTPDLEVIFEPHILLPILGLCALAALPILARVLGFRRV